MKDYFKENAITVLVLVKKETADDPEEGNVDTTKETNYIPIKAVFSIIKPESLQWKFYGKQVSEAGKLLIENSKVSLIRIAHEIKINGNIYEAGKLSNTSMQILPLEGEDYTSVTVWRV